MPVGNPTEADDTYILAIMAIMVTGLIVNGILLGAIAQRGGTWNIVLLLMELLVQAYFIRRILREWDTMSLHGRWKITLLGIFVPVLLPIAVVLTVVILAVGLVFWTWGAYNDSSPARTGNSRSLAPPESPRRPFIKDAYGSKIGSLDRKTGEIREYPGNLTVGWMNPQTGRMTDREGQHVGDFDARDGFIRGPDGSIKYHLDG